MSVRDMQRPTDALPNDLEVQRKLAEAGVFAGMRGLEGLLNATEFWEQQAYGTRLYYGHGGLDYLHHGVLAAAVRIIREQPSASDIQKLRDENDKLRSLLAERQTHWCDDPIPGQSYPEYACGKCWTCRVRAALTALDVSEKQP